jgi:hypothetical protein
MAINLLVMTASTKQKNDSFNVSTGLVWMPTSLIISKLATDVKFDKPMTAHRQPSSQLYLNLQSPINEFTLIFWPIKNK